MSFPKVGEWGGTLGKYTYIKIAERSDSLRWYLRDELGSQLVYLGEESTDRSTSVYGIRSVSELFRRKYTRTREKMKRDKRITCSSKTRIDRLDLLRKFLRGRAQRGELSESLIPISEGSLGDIPESSDREKQSSKRSESDERAISYETAMLSVKSSDFS